MQTQIRLVPEEQSDQGLHCLPFHLHLFDIMVIDLISYILKVLIFFVSNLFGLVGKYFTMHFSGSLKNTNA